MALLLWSCLLQRGEAVVRRQMNYWGKYATQNNSNIIALSFHVDYWNRLGWKDSFNTGV